MRLAPNAHLMTEKSAPPYDVRAGLWVVATLVDLGNGHLRRRGTPNLTKEKGCLANGVGGGLYLFICCSPVAVVDSLGNPGKCERRVAEVEARCL
mmetsp:Transcript_29294/g.89716  ORF Transcript_29294/g.89716 Transcript_29294/m.89716 type:complete len:95 (+) Transcript_29294:139-423(+)